MKLHSNHLGTITCISFFWAFPQTQAHCTDPMNAEFLLNLVTQMENGENIIFTKFGDGEYNAMTNQHGTNCDGDAYHTWLGEKLKQSLISLSQKPNTYIGKWWPWAAEVYQYCDQLAKQANISIPWAWYHLFLNDDNFLHYNYMYTFVKFIIHTDRKKIVICNKTNRRLKDLFRANTFIEIPAKNWSFEYDKWLKEIERHIEKNAIVLIAGGMCSKVLINDLTNKYDITCIDLGCSFDLLAGKRNSRGWSHTYLDEYNYYKELLPPTWD